jgi:O-antigen/teichoic acid export membrane protein
VSQNEDLSKWLQTRYLGRYLAYCLIGPGAPMFVALLTIPRVVAGLGVDRFGLLTLVWAIIGYFSLFDLGIGRATIRLVAEYRAQERTAELRTVVKTALAATAVLGVFGSLILVLTTPLLVARLLPANSPLTGEALHCFYAMAVAVPFISLTATLRGLLEVQQRFKLVNQIQIAMGFFTYLGPLISLQFFPGLFPVVVLLAGARILICGIFWLVTWPTTPASEHSRFDRAVLRRLLVMGGWLTVTNVVSPIIVYSDRFFIGSTISLQAVSYYATTFEAVYRLTVFSSAAAQVLYPALSTFVALDRQKVVRLLEMGTLAISAAVFPAVVVIVLFASQLLTLWLGAEFASHSGFVLRALAIGVMVNMCAQVPMVLLLGAEKAGWVARLHLLEFVIYIPTLYFTVKLFGINGVAVLWLLRSSLDYCALTAMTLKLVPEFAPFIRRFAATVLVSVMAIAGATLLPQLMARGALGAVLLAWFFLVLYKWLLNDEQRGQIQRWIGLLTMAR